MAWPDVGEDRGGQYVGAVIKDIGRQGSCRKLRRLIALTYVFDDRDDLLKQVAIVAPVQLNINLC